MLNDKLRCEKFGCEKSHFSEYTKTFNPNPYGKANFHVDQKFKLVIRPNAHITKYLIDIIYSTKQNSNGKLSRNPTSIDLNF